MSHLNNQHMTLSLLVVLVALFSIPTTHAATFVVKNNCPYPVWGAASPGGGQQMNPGDTWTVMVNAGQAGGRIWARTGCTSTGPNGLTCTTGDCGGVLQCTGYGKSPNTLAEYTLNGFSNLDYFDISLVEGFNVPMNFLPTDNGCTVGPTCSADLNANCPGELRTDQGCNNPCTGNPNCGPTDLTRYFKNLCPTAYSYSKDDPTSTFTCPGGTNYMVTFCP